MRLEPVGEGWFSRKIGRDRVEGYSSVLWAPPVRRSHWHIGEEENLSKWGRGWKRGRAVTTEELVGDGTSKTGYGTADFKLWGVANRDIRNYGLGWEQKEVRRAGTWVWGVKHILVTLIGL